MRSTVVIVRSSAVFVCFVSLPSPSAPRLGRCPPCGGTCRGCLGPRCAVCAARLSSLRQTNRRETPLAGPRGARRPGHFRFFLKRTFRAFDLRCTISSVGTAATRQDDSTRGREDWSGSARVRSRTSLRMHPASGSARVRSGTSLRMHPASTHMRSEGSSSHLEG